MDDNGRQQLRSNNPQQQQQSHQQQQQQQQQNHHHHHHHQSLLQQPLSLQQLQQNQQESDDIVEATLSTLLAHSSRTAKPGHFKDILPKFSSQLKTDFENRNLWLRFGLTISLSKESPRSALQAFNECMRIDQDDPLPAMLAAKILLQDLDDPEQALSVAGEAIRRCKNLLSCRKSVIGNDIVDGDIKPTYSTNNNTIGDDIELIDQQTDDGSVTSNRCYKNIVPMLSKSYILASIAHACIYEREPESIRNQFKKDNLKASLDFLDEAIKTNPNDYLVYFHKALHEAKQRTYPKAIYNLRHAIQINPHHIPTMQLLILSLSALKLYDEALVLCESVLHEHEDNLLLLYIKCNLEQNLVETKGYKVAFRTAQHMLKCIRQSANRFSENRNYSSTTTISATTQLTAINNSQQNHSSTTNTTTGPATTMTATSATAFTTTTTAPSSSGLTGTANSSTGTAGPTTTANANSALPVSISTPAGDTKNMTNLFVNDALNPPERRDFLCDGELSIWILVAEIFVKIGSVEDAEMCVDEGSIHANSALSHQVMFIRGLIAKARNHLMEAKTYFQSCLALYPRHAKALQQIAHVYYLMGNYPTAEKFLRDSLDLDGDSNKTWYYLSLVYIEMNQHDKASECVKKSTVLEESSPVVTFSAIPRLTLD